MKFHCFNLRNIASFLSVLFIFFLPPFFYVSLDLQSMTIGLAVALVIILLFFHQSLPIIKLRKSSIISLVLVASLFVHAILFTLSDFDVKKLLATIMMFVMIVAAGSFSIVIRKYDDEVVVRVCKLLMVISLLIGFGSLAIDFQYLNYAKYSKSIFPFSEPSHYALAVSSVIFAAGFFIRKSLRVALLILIVLLAVLTPSMILLSLSIVMMLVYYGLPLKLKNISMLTILLVVGIVMIKYTADANYAYFINRMWFDEANANLSALVYMQGWEELINSLGKTYGIGVGLRNMENTVPGYYGELIYSIAGEYKNRAEGSFLASKMITEFGIIGVSMLFVYCVLLLKSLNFFSRLNKYWQYRYRSMRVMPVPASLIYAHSVIVVFAIEVFARGVGYFSIGVFLFTMVIFWLLNDPAKFYHIEHA